MSNEDQKSDLDQTAAERVRSAYRELANEQTPDYLNARILRKAARAAQSPYSRSVHWTRPLAWAATIVLCLAITLQVTRVPAPEQMTVPMPAAPGTEEMSPAAAQATEFNAFSESRVDSPAQPASKEEIPLTAQDDNANVPNVAHFEIQDADLLERVEDRTHPEVDEISEPVRARASESAAGARLATQDIPRCDEKERADAKTWRDCILRLEEAGLEAVASEERKLLAEAFPEFKAP